MKDSQKEIYLKANELYLKGNVAEANELWSTLLPKGKKIEEEPLVWRLVGQFIFTKESLIKSLLWSCVILFSFTYGRLAFLIFAIFGELMYFESAPELFLFMSNMSSAEMQWWAHYEQLVSKDFWLGLSALPQYCHIKIYDMQHSFHFIFGSYGEGSGLIQMVSGAYLSFGIIFFSLSLLVDAFLLSKFIQYLIYLIKLIFSEKERIVRFLLALIVLMSGACYYYIFLKSYEKKEKFSYSLINMVENLKFKQESGAGENEKENKADDYTEKDILEAFKKEFDEKGMSLKERQILGQMYEDLKKMMQEMGLSGDKGNGEMPPEILEMLKKGEFDKIRKMFEQQKTLENLAKNMEGAGVDENMQQADKEFLEVLKKSFQSSDEKTLNEYLKTSKEMEQLYGKNIQEKLFGSSGVSKELLKQFQDNPQKARDALREKAHDEFQRSSGATMPSIETGLDFEENINSMVNYLETGGDIQEFYQMLQGFKNKKLDPIYEFYLYKKIDFVMASWNEHQGKYFWQMNRELMMDIVDMIVKSAEKLNYDVRGANLGWFYLVAGYYEKAREECLKSAQFNERNSALEGRPEVAFVNRSNAALAALMMQQGKQAFVEYKWIYQRVLEKKGIYKQIREEYFTEYLREITAALASDNPCVEGYLCRSLFLEGVNDKLAIADLAKYLSFSNRDAQLKKEAELKLKLLTSRLQQESADKK